MFSLKEMRNRYEEEVKEWYITSFEPKYKIQDYSGTWLHRVGFVLHFITFKIQALFLFNKVSYKSKPRSLDQALSSKLKAKMTIYKTLLPKHQDQFGFVMTDKCDSTLYSGLLGSVGVGVDIKAARLANGFWERRPLNPCYGSGSKSSFSRDMLVGLLWWIWRNKDLKLAEELYQHFKQNNFVMGLGDPSRLLVMSGLEATLAEIIFKLGGKNHFLARRQSQSWPLTLRGYEVHLSMLHLLLVGELKGGITKDMMKSLEHYGKDSCFAIVQFAYGLYVSGDLSQAAQTLLNSNLWPDNRLPTNKDRSADWLHTQDNPNDYKSSPDNDVHEFAGADFIFYGSLVLEDKG